MSEHLEPSDEKQPEPSGLTPEEQLLHAIFGRFPKKQLEDRPKLTEEERAAKEAAFRDKIDQVLKTLTYRECEVIKLRYGLGEGRMYTLEEVGGILKTTQERVRQIEAKALRKFQKPPTAGDTPKAK